MHRVVLASQMQSYGGKDADPQDMPIHNEVGADASMLLGMKLSMPRDEFLSKMQQMLLPE